VTKEKFLRVLGSLLAIVVVLGLLAAGSIFALAENGPPLPEDPAAWLYSLDPCNPEEYMGLVVDELSPLLENWRKPVFLEDNTLFVYGVGIKIEQGGGRVEDIYTTPTIVRIDVHEKTGVWTGVVEVEKGFILRGEDHWGFYQRYLQRISQCNLYGEEWSVVRLDVFPTPNIRRNWLPSVLGDAPGVGISPLPTSTPPKSSETLAPDPVFPRGEGRTE